VVVLALSLAVLAFRRNRAVAVAAVAVGGAWMLTSQIATTSGEIRFANRFRAHLPPHLDWVDRATHGRPTTYLGQEIVDPNGLWLTEWWNRSIEHVDSLDGTAPGPGPTYMPNLLRPNGLLSGLGDADYVVADNGVKLQAPVVARGLPTQLVLYERRGPWRLLDEYQQVYNDGWVPGWSTYTYFKPGEHGTLVIRIGRQGFNGGAKPGRVLVSVGSVTVGNGVPKLRRIEARRRTIVRDGSLQTLRIPVARTPVRVVLSIKPTFRAPPDPRNLGAQVSFAFEPAR
jgi:hypothetical protein